MSKDDAIRKQAFNKVLQLGFVVRNLDETVRIYEDIYKIGPWKIMEPKKGYSDGLRLRGKPVDTLGIRYAYCMVGEVQFELIQPLREGSPYWDYLTEKGEGIHHIAVQKGEGYKELMQERGIEELCGATLKYSGRSFAYYDTQDDLKVVTEVFG